MLITRKMIICNIPGNWTLWKNQIHIHRLVGRSTACLPGCPLRSYVSEMFRFRSRMLTEDQGGLYNGGVTSGLIRIENGRRFLTPLVCAGRLLTGWKAACSGKSAGVRLRSAQARAAFHPVSRQPAQTSGVRKRLPFSTGVVPPL